MMEKAISKLLKTGVFLSSFCLLIGALLLIFEKTDHSNVLLNTNFKDLTLNKFIDDLFTPKSSAFLFLGVLILILTPVSRIILSLTLFIKEKNKSFVLICGITLIVILLSIITKLLS